MEFEMLLYFFSYIFQSLGNIWLCYNIIKKKTSEGISYYSQFIYIISAILKILTLFNDEIYNEFFGQIDAILFIISNIILFYLIRKYKKNNYFIENKSYLHFILIFIAIIITYFIMPMDSHEAIEYSQFFIVGVLVLECIGIIPQLLMMKKNNLIYNYYGVYLVFITISRVLRIYFWYLLGGWESEFIYFIILELISIILVSNILYIYFKNRNLEMIPLNN